eukprot:1553168-Pleurochrysis_carterae.AAC.2
MPVDVDAGPFVPRASPQLDGDFAFVILDEKTGEPIQAPRHGVTVTSRAVVCIHLFALCTTAARLFPLTASATDALTSSSRFALAAPTGELYAARDPIGINSMYMGTGVRRCTRSAPTRRARAFLNLHARFLLPGARASTDRPGSAPRRSRSLLPAALMSKYSRRVITTPHPVRSRFASALLASISISNVL